MAPALPRGSGGLALDQFALRGDWLASEGVAERAATYRAKLERALSEVFGVERPDDDGFVLRRAAKSPVRVIAAERDVAARAQAIAPDALLALGVIDDNPFGMMAAAGLLAIHVEELVASQPAVSVIRITRSGVHVQHGSLHSGAE